MNFEGRGNRDAVGRNPRRLRSISATPTSVLVIYGSRDRMRSHPMYFYIIARIITSFYIGVIRTNQLSRYSLLLARAKNIGEKSSHELDASRIRIKKRVREREGEAPFCPCDGGGDAGKKANARVRSRGGREARRTNHSKFSSEFSEL